MIQAATDQQQEDLADAFRRSAAVVVPLVLRWFPGVRSVVDFGCGSATWLAELSICGVPRVTGIEYEGASQRYLFIPRESFRLVDPSRPLEDLERHDLAMSLEVAQRLPDALARLLVRNLTRASDLVLFSAAAPLQVGDGDPNARWPSHWVRVFADHGYRCHDVLRPVIWNDRRVEWWFRQNLLLFVKEGVVAPALAGLPSFGGSDLVHPHRLLAVGNASPEASAAGEADDYPPRVDLARRLSPSRSGLLRAASKGLLNIERAMWRIACLLRGETKESFRRKWQSRLEEKLILRSGLFDAGWYSGRYPDAAASGMKPIRHYLTVGAKERRDPGPAFSAKRYLARHPWVEQDHLNPLLHFLREQLERSRRA